MDIRVLKQGEMNKILEISCFCCPLEEFDDNFGEGDGDGDENGGDVGNASQWFTKVWAEDESYKDNGVYSKGDFRSDYGEEDDEELMVTGTQVMVLLNFGTLDLAINQIFRPLGCRKALWWRFACLEIGRQATSTVCLFGDWPYGNLYWISFFPFIW